MLNHCFNLPELCLVWCCLMYVAHLLTGSLLLHPDRPALCFSFCF